MLRNYDLSLPKMMKKVVNQNSTETGVEQTMLTFQLTYKALPKQPFHSYIASSKP